MSLYCIDIALLAAVEPAAPTDDARAALCQLWLSPSADTVATNRGDAHCISTLFATDSYRLAIASDTAENIAGAGDALLPADQLISLDARLVKNILKAGRRRENKMGRWIVFNLQGNHTGPTLPVEWSLHVETNGPAIIGGTELVGVAHVGPNMKSTFNAEPAFEVLAAPGFNAKYLAGLHAIEANIKPYSDSNRSHEPWVMLGGTTMKPMWFGTRFQRHTSGRKEPMPNIVIGYLLMPLREHAGRIVWDGNAA